MQAWYEKVPRNSDVPIRECQGCGRPLYSNQSQQVGLCLPCERSNPNLGNRRHRGPDRNRGQGMMT